MRMRCVIMIVRPIPKATAARLKFCGFRFRSCQITFCERKVTGRGGCLFRSFAMQPQAAATMHTYSPHTRG